MNALVQFLRDRLDEDEATARAAGDGWYGYEPEQQIAFVPPEDSRHIARHDPARVLAEVEAKRRTLGLHRPVEQRSTGSGGGAVRDCHVCQHFPAQYPCTTLRLLALPYADHPDYRDDWRP